MHVHADAEIVTLFLAKIFRAQWIKRELLWLGFFLYFYFNWNYTDMCRQWLNDNLKHIYIIFY